MNLSRFRPLALFVSMLVLCSVAAAQTGGNSRIEIPDAVQPQLAADAQGRIWLAYGRSDPPAVASHQGGGHGAKGGHVHGAPRPPGEIFVARSDDRGATFGAAQSIARVPNLMLGNRRGPRIAVHGERVTITVIGHELLALDSSDGGKTWRGQVTINDVPASAREGLHDLALAPDGTLFVTWLDLRNGKMELWGAESGDGGRTWGTNAPLYRSPDKSICECCHPSALFDAQGNLAVMWRNSIEGARDMWIMTRSKGAKKFSSPRKLGEGTWKLNACPMDGGDLLALGQGEFGAVWQRNGEVFLSRGDRAETSLGKGRQPIVVSPDGRSPMVLWQQGSDLVAREAPGAASPVTRARDGRFPSMVTLAGGKAVLLAYERGERGATSVVVERL